MIACGHLVAGEVQRLLADHLGDAVLDREVGRLVEREVERPFREQVDEVVAQLSDPVLRHRAHRVQRVEVAERRGRLHLRGDVAVLEPVDLVQRDDHRDAEPEDAAGDEAVAGADPIARRDDEQDDVDVLERRVDRVLHPLGQRVHRALEAGQVGEHELPVRPVRDAEDPPPGRVRDVRGDRHLVAAERVDERRLADVRAGPRRRRIPTSREVAGVELLGQELVDRHPHDAAAVAEDDPLDLHLGEPLPAAAARRRGDRGDREVSRDDIPRRSRARTSSARRRPRAGRRRSRR